MKLLNKYPPTMKFAEAQLESAIIELLGVEDHPHVLGEAISGNDGVPAPSSSTHPNDAVGATSLPEVLIEADLRTFLTKHYAADHLASQGMNHA